MNENEEPNLTTRRARRMQEQLETTGIPVITPEIAAEVVAAESSESTRALDGIEISPVDADGRPRTRREMRELREAALKSRADNGATAESLIDIEADVDQESEVRDEPGNESAPDSERGREFQSDIESSSDSVPEVESETELITEDEVESETESEPNTEALDDPAVIVTDAFVIEDSLAVSSDDTDELEEDSRFAESEAVVVPNSDFDARLADTEALSLADLDIDAASEDEADTRSEGEATKPKGRFRLPWARSKDVVSDDPAVESSDASLAEFREESLDAIVDEPAQEPLEAAAVHATDDSPLVDAPAAMRKTAHAGTSSPVIDEADERGSAITEIDGDEDLRSRPAGATDTPFPTVDEDEDGDGEVVGAPAPTSARTTYSFPDIVPLDEERSVFDDPSTQALTTLPTQDLVTPQVERTGDFDDLISRAVAAEGASSANTAALILPSMPDGVDLTGPLGETGELFVTGSIELPRSLGETGGHARLHESVDFDPLSDLGIDLSSEPVPGDSSPISASRAISARTVQGSGVIAPHTKKGNRLPLILSITAGGLLLAFIGLLAWGASNGMFQ